MMLQGLPGTTSTRPLLEGVRSALEDSLLAIADRSDTKDLADTLREGIALLSRLVEAAPRDEDALEALARTAAALKAARERLPVDAVVGNRIEGAARWLADASERLRGRLPARVLGAGAEAATQREEVVASVGVPRAHPVFVPPPRVLTREEAASVAGARGRALLGASRGAAGDLAQIRAIARDCFEDIASLGSLRRLYEHEPWVDAGPFEQRLLDNLDALVALERPLDPAAPSLGLVESLFAYAIEWVVPDFGRTFALAFTLCCLDAETAMRWVVLALRRSHPRTYPAFVDAFALGSNEAIDRTLVELCREDDPAMVEVALEAMVRRGRVDMASAVLLLMRPSPSPGVLDKAIDLAARLPAQAATPLLARLLDNADLDTTASAAAALTTLGDARGPKHLRALLQRPRTEDFATLRARRIALEALCLLGSPFDRNLLGTEASLDREGLPWLGWHGHPDHVPVLLEGIRRAAANGAFDEADRIGRALERIGGGSAPRPGALAGGDFEERLAAWLRAFEERRPLDNPRMRFGQPWTPSAIVTELSARGTRQGERPILARELALVTRRAAHVDVAGWVVVQERALAAARDALPRQP
ncbi:hypothetical protein [Polyangium mundeleinium]|uniref:HEAT repeat domain-containing protein n=1 Tax=Polyangium mundeleinium TaxID=2995306 RepID=A0ABT5F278_9BACT|nr:hypothetical protein [Polyangium mundeleinium]MDC0747528.1 hypothetical protein [Polyangium mundeleinium]